MRRLFAIAAVAALSAALMVPAQANNVLPDFTVALSGAEEVGGGDPDGSGIARVDFGRDQVCFIIDLTGVEDVTAAHIHAAPAGVNGPIVIDFDLPNNGLEGCVTSDRQLMRQILRNPAGYYVNVHSVPFPAGAVRGQLG